MTNILQKKDGIYGNHIDSYLKKKADEAILACSLLFVVIEIKQKIAFVSVNIIPCL